MERRRQNATEGLGTPVGHHEFRRHEFLDKPLDQTLSQTMHQQALRPRQSRNLQRVAAGLLAGVMVTTAGIEPWLGVPAAWAQSPAEKPKKEKAKAKGKPKGDTKAPAKKDAKDSKEGKEPKEAPLSEADLKKARESYAAGEQKFKAADYAGALAEFKVAHSVKATPNTARYIGLCADNLQMPQEAVAAYEAFLANVPPKFADEADEIRGRVAQLRTRPASITLITNPPGSDILVDGKPHPSKTPTQVDLAPGKHELVIAQAGFVSQNKEVDVQFGAREEWKVELEKQPAPPPGTVIAEIQPKTPVAPVETAPVVVPPPPPPKRSKTPAYITGGLAIASAGIGTFFGLQALKAQSDFKANPTLTGANSGENKALIADMAFGVAVTLGVTSVVLLTAKNEAPAAAPTEAPKPQASNRGGITVHPVPVLYPSGGGAGAVVRF